MPIDFSANTGQAQAGILQLNNTLRILQRTLRRTARDIEGTPDIDFRNSIRSTNAFGESIRRLDVFIGNFFANLASDALRNFSNLIFESGVEMDALRARVIALNNTVQEGEAHYNRIFQIAQELGIPFQSLVESTLQLRNYGFESAEEIERLARQFAVLSGGSDQNLERLARALGQVVGGGRVALEELNQFSDVIPIFNALSEVVGVSGRQIREMVSRSEISVEQLIEALNRLETGTFGVAAIAQADTVQADLERIQNELLELVREIVADLGPNLINLLKSIQQVLVPLLSQISKHFNVIKDAIFVIGSLLGLRLFSKFAGFLSSTFNPILTKTNEKFRGLLNSLGKVYNQQILDIKNLQKVGKEHTALGKKNDLLAERIKSLTKAQKDYTTGIEDLVNKKKGLRRLVSSLGLYFKNLAIRVGGLITVFSNLGRFLPAVVAALATGPGSIIGALVLLASSATAAIFSMRRARKELGEFGETAKAIADEDLTFLQRVFYGIGDAINKGIYLPLRRSQLEARIKTLREALETSNVPRVFRGDRNELQRELNKIEKEYETFLSRLYRIRNEIIEAEPYTALLELRPYDIPRGSLPEIIPGWITALENFVDEYHKAYREIQAKDFFGLFEDEAALVRAHIGNITNLLEEFAKSEIKFPENATENFILLLFQYRERLKQLTEEQKNTKKSLEELLNEYNRGVEIISDKALFGIIETELEVYRETLRNLDNFIQAVIDNDIPLSEVQGLLNLYKQVRRIVRELELDPIFHVNTSFNRLSEIIKQSRQDIARINKDFELSILLSHTKEAIEEASLTKIRDQIDVWRQVILELETVLSNTSETNEAYALIIENIELAKQKMLELSNVIRDAVPDVKDIRNEFEKLFNIDITTGFGDFLKPGDLSRAIKSIEKVAEVVERVGSSIGSFLNTIVETINISASNQIRRLQDELNEFAERRRNLEQEYRRQLQKEEEALKRQHEAGIISFEDYYQKLDEARAEDKRKRDDLEDEENKLREKIARSRYNAELQAFNIGKVQALAQLAFNSAIAIIRAFADFPYPVALGISGLIGGLALAQKGLIISQQPPPPPVGFAEGGIITGGQGGVRGLVGEGTSDELITPISNRARRAIEEGLTGAGNLIINYPKESVIIEERNAVNNLYKLFKQYQNRGRVGVFR